MTEIIFSKSIDKILENLDYSKLGKDVGIKLHFGEKGCITYINPEIVKKVYQKIKSLGKNVKLIECNVLYKGSRTTKKEHIQTAKSHGFDFAEIDILDGEYGEEFIDVGGRKLGKGLKKYDSLVVLSHFKGHPMAGFGGALKNLGMGLGSRAGKLDMHCNIKPSIDKDKCLGCKECINHCNAKAITLINNKAEIDKNKCEGCAMCIAVCLNNAIEIPWQGKSAQELQKRIADYASAVFQVIPQEKMIFINVLENITKDCDCFETQQVPIMPDIGILAGYDAVSIDQASLDLVNKKGFDSINKINKQAQIDYGEQIGLGEKGYEILTK